MWIRSTVGNYVNSNNIFALNVKRLESGDVAVIASDSGSVSYFTLAIFDTKADAQNFLDKFMKQFGTIARVSMEDWNYTGHRKDRKETRHGGS